MNNEGLGIDIVEINRIESLYTESFVKRILSVDELKLYDKMTNNKRKLEFLAGRFAAKEAYVKAYQHIDGALNFNEVSILNDAYGAPYLSAPLSNDQVLISISHSDQYAVAVCSLKRGVKE